LTRMQTLTDIQSGARVLLHVSILLQARWGVSPDSRAFLRRCQGKTVQGVITPFTIAEFCDFRMRQEADTKGFMPEEVIENRPRLSLGGSIHYATINRLSDNPDVVRNLSIYADDTRALLSGELELAAVHPEDFLEALFLQKMHGLRTNDSLNLAIARRLGINEIAAADHAYDSVQGLIVYRPRDFKTRP